MIEIHRARFVGATDVDSQRIAGYAFSLLGGDVYFYTHAILAIWPEGGELFVEDKAGCTYHIIDFAYDESVSEIGCMREDFSGVLTGQVEAVADSLRHCLAAI